jgi:flagellar assembly protein FliH
VTNLSEQRQPQARPIERWLPPKVEGGTPGRPRDERGPHSRTQQAEAAGYAAGIARAQAETQARLAELARQVERFDALARQLAEPLRALDDEVEQALLALATTIGAQLARRALEADPTQLIALVRECLKELPLGSREVRVHLHPGDAAVARERLARTDGERAWSLVEDPALTRGGCLIESEHSQIDARFESRLNGLIAAALGDARAESRGPSSAVTDPEAGA